jgi:hypothetical protein
MYSGIGESGFTNDLNSPIISPPLTFTAPISVMAAPDQQLQRSFLEVVRSWLKDTSQI